MRSTWTFAPTDPRTASRLVATRVPPRTRTLAALLCGVLAAWCASTIAAPARAGELDASPSDTVVIRLDAADSTAAVDSVARIRIESRPKQYGLLHDLGSAGVAIASDFWYVVSSPARLNRTGLLWTTGVVAASVATYTYDREILDGVLRNREAPVFREVLRVGTNLEPLGMMGRTNPYYAGVLGVGYTLGIQPMVRIPAEIIESHLIAGGIRNAVKVMVGRRHPFEDPSPRTFDSFQAHGGTSFPSGHTSVVFELATVASMNAHSTPVSIAAYSLAGAVAVQRISSRSHWPSDVVVPAVTGTFIARAVVNRHEARSMAYVPFYETRDGVPTVGLATRF